MRLSGHPDRLLLQLHFVAAWSEFPHDSANTEIQHCFLALQTTSNYGAHGKFRAGNFLNVHCILLSMMRLQRAGLYDESAESLVFPAFKEVRIIEYCANSNNSVAYTWPFQNDLLHISSDPILLCTVQAQQMPKLPSSGFMASWTRFAAFLTHPTHTTTPNSHPFSTPEHSVYLAA